MDINAYTTYMTWSRGQCVVELARKQATVDTICEHWAAYVAFLRERYPAKVGEAWEFTCPHHKAIDRALARIVSVEIPEEP